MPTIPQDQPLPQVYPYKFLNVTTNEWEEFNGRLNEMDITTASRYVPRKYATLFQNRVDKAIAPGIALILTLSDAYDSQLMDRRQSKF